MSEASASKPRWTWLKCAVAGEGKVQLHLLSQMLPHVNSATALIVLTSSEDARGFFLSRGASIQKGKDKID